MSTVAARFDTSPERLWVGTVSTTVAMLVLGSLVAPETVYDSFLWHYFWGPVQADANSAVCAIRPGSTVQYLTSTTACANAAEPVAYPGYTLVSEVGYMITLLVALIGVVFLLRQLKIGSDRQLFYALTPFISLAGHSESLKMRMTPFRPLMHSSAIHSTHSLSVQLSISLFLQSRSLLLESLSGQNVGISLTGMIGCYS